MKQVNWEHGYFNYNLYVILTDHIFIAVFTEGTVPYILSLCGSRIKNFINIILYAFDKHMEKDPGTPK